MFIAALFTIAKKWKQPEYPLTEGWINNMWYIYNNVTSSIKGIQYYYMLQHG